jgi:tetratricopeptide (TPR) repeat protein
MPGKLHAAADSGPSLQHTLELSKRYPDSAFLLLKKLHHDALLRNDKRTIGVCLQQMGEICYSQGHYAQSLEYHQQAARIFGQLNDKRLLADNFNDMGIVYYQNIDKKSSRKQYDQAMRLYKELNSHVGLGETYGNIGHLYEKQQQYDSAFYYQRQALKQYSNADHKGGMAKIYENLGSIFEDLERYDSARVYFDRSLVLYKAVNNEVSSIEVINNIGDILRKTGNYRDGLAYAAHALQLSLETKNEYQQASAYRDIAKSFNLLGKNDSAFHYMELSRKHLLHIYSDQNNRQMSFLQIIYDTDKKNDEIAGLENSRKVNLIISIAVVIVILLLIVMGLLTISRQGLKLRENIAVSEKNKQLNRAQQEQLELKSRELTTHTLQVIQHNQFLERMRSKLDEMINEDKRDQKKQLQQLVRQINQNINHDQQWKDFTVMFEQLHQSFFDRLKSSCGDLTVNDIRLIALLKMNMSSKDMAAIFGISQDSLRVARYRLRKKLTIGEGDNLSSFIQTI